MGFLTNASKSSRRAQAWGQIARSAMNAACRVARAGFRPPQSALPSRPCSTPARCPSCPVTDQSNICHVVVRLSLRQDLCAFCRANPNGAGGYSPSAKLTPATSTRRNRTAPIVARQGCKLERTGLRYSICRAAGHDPVRGAQLGGNEARVFGRNQRGADNKAEAHIRVAQPCQVPCLWLAKEAIDLQSCSETAPRLLNSGPIARDLPT